MESEEQHRNVLRRAHDWPSRSGVAVVRVTLIQRKKVVLCARKLFALHHPAIEYLKGKEISDQFRVTFHKIHFGISCSAAQLCAA